MQSWVNDIIDHYYPEAEVPELRRILLVHSTAVAEKALKICRNHPELEADEQFVYDAAMLHDIGIVRCNAPSIHCHGTEDYLKHGPIGAEMLAEASKEGWCEIPDAEKYQRVCARHTGTGLPGLEPDTTEEKIVCYADKFFSKTRLEHEKTVEEAIHSLKKFGQHGVEIFKEWNEKFGN